MRLTALFVLVVTVLSGCGGGDGNPGTCSASAQTCLALTQSVTKPTGQAWVESSIPSSFSVAQQCVSPRASSVIDPYTRQPYGDQQGTLSSEKSWIRAYVDETYLWYHDVVPQNPDLFVVGGLVNYVEPSNNASTRIQLSSSFEVVDTYFNSLRSTLLTSSGKPRDQFHFTYGTDEWLALSTSGSSIGFGFEVALLASSPPREALISYIEPGTSAADNGLKRGTKFISVNGVDIATGAPAVLNEGLFSPIPGTQYTFQVLDPGSATPRAVVMTASAVTSTPVQNVRTLPSPNSNVGYLLFNSHIATAEKELVTAVNQLKAANAGAGISDLVLDLRYNGGGLLTIASELAYMVAGPSATNGKAFERTVFNDKNPFSATEADLIAPFQKLAVGFSTPEGVALPYLGLSRVYVITGKGTCSASESIINGLLGVGIEVMQIGETTCGKPYGFYPQDNCSVTYFTIQFKGVNDAGFGDYADGFSPGGNHIPPNNLPGCVVKDDFTQALGDPAEARLAAALQFRSNGSCPTAKASTLRLTAPVPGGVALNGRRTLMDNRFYTPRTTLRQSPDQKRPPDSSR